MTRQVRQRRGRAATTAAILDAAEELFYEHGYGGVSHALVHQYAGSKTDLFRTVLSRNEDFTVSGALGDPDLLDSASRILRHGLEKRGREHARLLMGSALSGLPYERTTGRFAAVDRLTKLARRQAESASAAERTEKDLDPRLVVACVGSLYLGWVAGEPWMRPAAGLEDMDDAELIDGLERVIVSILKDHVPGVASGIGAIAETRVPGVGEACE
jgi:AcrR family transcriptional regulator